MINIKRILKDIDQIASISNPNFPLGCTRHSYSPQDREAREYLYREMDKLGLAISVDGVGNIRGRAEGRDSGLLPILIGSHIDTVTSGGKYDGLMGVISSLECLRSIKEEGLRHRHPIDLIIFAEEEGSNFGVTMLGSKVMAGKLGLEDLKKLEDDRGISAYDLIRDAGYRPDSIGDHVLSRGEIGGLLELHIEQGGTLEAEKKTIGIVDKIAGMKIYKVALKGTSNHAGSTRMKDRRDPLLGASELILKINEFAGTLESGVATVGKLFLAPNITNAIADEVQVYVDLRDVTEEGLEKLSTALEEIVGRSAEKYGLDFHIDLLGSSDIVDLDPEVGGLIREAAESVGHPYMVMDSGAVHDSVMLTDFARVGMIFIPSIGGRSHCPEEYSRAEDIEVGCKVLMEAIIKLDNEVHDEEDN